MKSEHRHELQTNELAKLVEKAWAWVISYATPVVVVICALSVSIAGYRYISTSSTISESGAWGEFASARTPEAYSDIAKLNYPDSSAADWALLVGAEMRLSVGIKVMFRDREKAVSDLEDSIDDFETLINNSHPVIKERAIFGLACTQESLGNVAAARSEYEKLAAQEYENSPYYEVSKERAAHLKKDGPQDFYAWFSQQNPKPPEAPEPDDPGSALDLGLPFSTDLPFGTGDLGPLPSDNLDSKEDPESTVEEDKALPKLDEASSEDPPALEAPAQSEAQEDAAEDGGCSDRGTRRGGRDGTGC